MTLSLLVYMIALFAAIFMAGTLLCLKLYKWEYNRYFTSQLWIKTYYWIPIFAYFLAILYLQIWGAIAALILLAYLAVRELLNLKVRTWHSIAYTMVIVIAIAHLIFYFITFDEDMAVTVLILIVFSSVMSDICAYFSGNFLGRHKLPDWINSNKSWEGVFGQLLGAVIGFLLVTPIFQQAPSIQLALIIGAASAFGDILNSVVKRNAGIKDWGNTIPGHGGILDRFASLAFALAAAYYFAILAF